MLAQHVSHVQAENSRFIFLAPAFLTSQDGLLTPSKSPQVLDFSELTSVSDFL